MTAARKVHDHTLGAGTAPMPSATDLALLGAALWSTVAVVNQLGHQSPASTLDYTTAFDASNPELGDDVSAAGTIMRDFIAWTSGRKHLAPGCEERLRSYVVRCGWQASSAEAVASEALT